MTTEADDSELTGWKHFRLPMALCLLVGLLFIAVVNGFNVPKLSRQHINPIVLEADARAGASPAPAQAAPPRKLARHSEAQLARLGGFMAYRGYAILAVTAAAIVIVVSLFSIFLFVREARAFTVVLSVFALELGVALIGTVFGGTAMGKIADRMTCSARRATEPWDFCSLRIGETAVQLGFNRWVEVICTVAAVAVIFAIFVVARSRRSRPLPPIVEGQARCVTILMVTASTLLTLRLLLNKGFLQWAYADLLAVERPSSALNAYIAGTSTFNGALETALLAITWFIALLLMERGPGSGAGSEARATAGAGFSVYNFSAIFAPVLSAMGTNFLGGG